MEIANPDTLYFATSLQRRSAASGPAGPRSRDVGRVIPVGPVDATASPTSSQNPRWRRRECRAQKLQRTCVRRNSRCSYTGYTGFELTVSYYNSYSFPPEESICVAGVDLAGCDASRILEPRNKAVSSVGDSSLGLGFET